jgi:hypothetical protein
MSLLTVVRDVCAVVGVAAPSSGFAALGSNRTMFEMLACANEMAQRIAADTRDWTMLRVSMTLIGDGVTTAFNLPANYRRMLLNSNVWLSTSTQQPMRFFSDTDEWVQRRAAGENDAWGEWTMYGGQIHIWPAMSASTTARFIYLDRNPIALTSGGYGEEFMADTDVFRLDQRLLKLGMIYDWKMKKGSPYAEDMGTYSDAIATAMGHDKPSPIIIGQRGSSYAKVAIPTQTITVPINPYGPNWGGPP